MRTTLEELLHVAQAIGMERPARYPSSNQAPAVLAERLRIPDDPGDPNSDYDDIDILLAVADQDGSPQLELVVAGPKSTINIQVCTLYQARPEDIVSALQRAVLGHPALCEYINHFDEPGVLVVGAHQFTLIHP